MDLNLPVIVTRVANNTPADLALPRLNEGDQVVKINGRETDSLVHEDVVKLIKASRDTKSGELVLHVRPNGESRLVASSDGFSVFSVKVINS